MPDAPAAPPTRVTAVSPWDVLESLRRFGASWVKTPERVDLVAQALRTLGLIDAASDEASLDELRDRLVGSERIVGEAERRAILERNLHADSRGALPREAIDRAERSLSREILLRTSGGDLVYTAAGRSALYSWRWIGAVREEAERAAEKLAAARGALAPPAALVGVSPPWGALALLETTIEREAGQTPYQRRIHLIEPDAAGFARALTAVDLSGLLRSDRVSWHLGRDAVRSLELELSARPDQVSPGGAAASAGDEPPPGLMPEIAEALERIDRAKTERQRELALRVNRRHEGASVERWAARFEEIGGGAPARVLISTSLHSTFIRHAGLDLQRAFEALGHEARLLMEPDAHSLNTASALLGAVDDLEPDLVIVPNHLRAGLSTQLPENLPFLTWIQDAMGHLFSSEAMGRVGSFDLFAGYAYAPLFTDFGVAPEAATLGPVPVSARKFHSGAVDGARRERVACDVAIFSNHGVPPERLREQLLTSLERQPALRRVAEELCDAAPAVVDRAPWESLAELTREITGDALARGLGRDPAPDELRQMEHGVLLPMAGRVLRHRVARQAAAICQRRGWRLRIFGAHWELSDLGEHAAPALAHGEELRAGYASAAATLHVDLRTLTHQRVLECGLSGGLPISFFFRDALSRATHSAALGALDRGAEAVRTLEDGRRVFRCEGSEDAERLAVIRRALGDTDADELVQPEGCPPAIRFDEADLALYDATRLLPDVAGMTFTDEATLEAALERAVTDDAWRAERSGELARRIGERYTYEAFARRLLEHARSRFAALAEG